MTGTGSRSPGRSLSVAHLLVTDGFAGAERYVVQVATALDRRGHHVVTLGGDPDRMRAELPPGVSHRPVAHLLPAAAALASAGPLDLVHVHMTAAEGAAWLARPFVRAPVVATRHFAKGRGSNAVARTLARVTTRAIDCDIAISQFVAESIHSPSEVIPNGVPDRTQAPLEAPTVVMLQRLDTEKATDVGIRAFARSGLAQEGWRLVVAGQGDLRPALLQLVDDLDMVGRVDLVGHVAATDQLLAQASVLLAPAPLEPFGLSVVEAMAHGLPVVAAAGGAHLETVGATGLLFPPGDDGSAAAALARLAADPGLRRRVGGALRRRQQEHFTLTGHVDRLEGLYRRMVEGAGREGPAGGGASPPAGDPVQSPLGAPT